MKKIGAFKNRVSIFKYFSNFLGKRADTGIRKANDFSFRNCETQSEHFTKRICEKKRLKNLIATSRSFQKTICSYYSKS